MPTFTLTTTAQKVVASNPQRISLVITNTSTTAGFFGQDNTVTAANGVKLGENGTISEDSGGTKLYLGDWWGITASGTADVRYWERTRAA